MSIQNVTLLVIGQTPRPDLEVSIIDRCSFKDQVDIKGAMDGWSREQLTSVEPSSAADTLFTLLPDGTSVTLSHKAVEGELNRILKELGSLNTKAAVLCCTAPFESIKRPNLYSASEIFSEAVCAFAADRKKMGVFVPKPEQASLAIERWSGYGFEPIIVPLEPDSSNTEIREAALNMRNLEPEFIAYDCIAYTEDLQRCSKDVHGREGIVAASAIAEFCDQLLWDLNKSPGKKAETDA